MRLFEEKLPKCPFIDPVDMAGCSSQPMQIPLGCGQVPARKGQALIAGPPSHFIDVETGGPKTGDGPECCRSSGATLPVSLIDGNFLRTAQSGQDTLDKLTVSQMS